MNDFVGADRLREWIGRHLDPIDDGDACDGVHLQPDATGRLRADDGLWLDAPPTPAAVLIGLVERPHGYNVLLTRRSDTLRKHTGQIAFPGGRRDPGETAWQTALREAEEEIGLDPAFVSLAGLSTPTITGSGYLITPVVGFVRPGFELQPNPHEVADIFETPFGFLMNPGNYSRHEVDVGDGTIRHYYEMTHEERRIWGVTAGILRALYDRLYGAALS